MSALDGHDIDALVGRLKALKLFPGDLRSVLDE